MSQPPNFHPHVRRIYLRDGEVRADAEGEETYGWLRGMAAEANRPSGGRFQLSDPPQQETWFRVVIPRKRTPQEVWQTLGVFNQGVAADDFRTIRSTAYGTGGDLVRVTVAVGGESGKTISRSAEGRLYWATGTINFRPADRASGQAASSAVPEEDRNSGAHEEA
jgi:hypothetical protein